MASQTEQEFAEFDNNRVWTEVYQRLRNEASLLTLGDEFSSKISRYPQNRRKNRYRDVSPYDHSRVVLSGENDYINASLIDVPEAERKYILTQGPLDQTMCDFWQMAWEQGSRAIVMLNRVIEKGAVKCAQYWPLGTTDYGCEDDMFFPECGLKVSLKGENTFSNFIVRTLEMTHIETGEKREILHFHYTTWPDFGVPSSPNAFLLFLSVIRQTGSLDINVGPSIVHCSAGIGRSGTFCLVDSCLMVVEKKNSLQAINVREALIRMRSYRMGLIQTADQLRFSYLAILQGAHTILEGSGLESVSDEQNHAEGPPPPLRSSSLHHTATAAAAEPPPPTVAATGAHAPTSYENQQSVSTEDLLADMDTGPPPPLFPKKGSRNNEVSGQILQRQAGSSKWEDEEDEEFDQLIDREESGTDSEEEAKAVELRHRIREERKKQTMEQLRKMKERQRRSERWRPYKKFYRPSLYFGLAVLVGVAGVFVYKYFM
ncbi:tyrosine-protein phosphatase non-receptor type [Elysia marginata]|uniref:protein-tyrosine-phosphatase n=1 Tax=Elysia marginata TaxID=1093978 RepID=A0AAV4J2J9_9GAST|nr:tyrosine-protein phosphatase non-receptor type [Elysia marginata]